LSHLAISASRSTRPYIRKFISVENRHRRNRKETYAHDDMYADCGCDNSRPTSLRDLADVARNFHGFAAFSKRGDDIFLRLEEGGLIIVLYVKEDCTQ
jgi:hypothetical protein